MANACDFNVKATGPGPSLAALFALLSAHVTHSGGAYAEYVVKSGDIWPDHDPEEVPHDWTGFDSLQLHRDKVLIHGCCKWAGPSIMNRLSREYPDLVFAVQSTVEHEEQDSYEICAGEEKCICRYVEDIRWGRQTWHCRDGVYLDPPETVDVWTPEERQASEAAEREAKEDYANWKPQQVDAEFLKGLEAEQ
jgi:hypothetical protein